jgi:hypothetical protein
VVVERSIKTQRSPVLVCMERSIYRGKVVIGSIVCPSESGAPVFGLEVLATSVVPSEDDDNQFESFDAAEWFLNQRWDAYCQANGIEPEPQAAPAVEIDEETAYYARLAADDAAYVAYVDGQGDPNDQPLVEAHGTDTDQAPPAEGDADPSDEDDFPF